jgi:glucose-1-phosphate thymidylyltransferase
MLSGVTEILVITNPVHMAAYQELLKDGSQWGLDIRFVAQDSPGGIPEAFILAPREFKNVPVALALGDNVLYGMGLGSSMREIFKGEGALVFAHQVSNPSEYGVVKLNNEGKVKQLVEKPETFVSNLAIPGIYFFDETVFEKSASLKPSKRGELEIMDLLKLFEINGNLQVHRLERGTAWLDTGTPESLLEASEFVRVIQKRQGLIIGSPEEVAFREKLISNLQFRKLIELMPKSNYRDILSQIKQKI